MSLAGGLGAVHRGRPFAVLSARRLRAREFPLQRPAACTARGGWFFRWLSSGPGPTFLKGSAGSERPRFGGQRLPLIAWEPSIRARRSRIEDAFSCGLPVAFSAGFVSRLGAGDFDDTGDLNVCHDGREVASQNFARTLRRRLGREMRNPALVTQSRVSKGGIYPTRTRKVFETAVVTQLPKRTTIVVRRHPWEVFRWRASGKFASCGG